MGITILARQLEAVIRVVPHQDTKQVALVVRTVGAN